ncbi:MAG: SCP2 sterol-binding domain-containing protein [Bernardetiaceae bacterium]|jgi:putative sterol carrier protein|nr:SCP2 sterol-binding domain-containing protein [Bernardetiaceae bacterium]
MNILEITDKIKGLVDGGATLPGTLQLQLDGGHVFVDTSAQPPVVNNEMREAGCTIKTTLATLSGLLTGDLNVMMAMMTGKLKISGDMNTAMKVAQLISQ